MSRITFSWKRWFAPVPTDEFVDHWEVDEHGDLWIFWVDGGSNPSTFSVEELEIEPGARECTEEKSKERERLRQAQRLKWEEVEEGGLG